MAKKIKRNRAKCSVCRTIIESPSSEPEERVKCTCRTISIYGGKNFLGRFGDRTKIIELAEYY